MIYWYNKIVISRFSGSEEFLQARKKEPDGILEFCQWPEVEISGGKTGEVEVTNRYAKAVPTH